MERIERRLRDLTETVLMLAGLLAVLLVIAGSASATVTACLEDESGTPLRRMWVEHGFETRMTNADGCVTLDASGTIDVRVHAHNPVVRMDDGGNFAIGVSQVVHVANGQTRRISNQSEWFQIAERARRAYNDGLRNFEPWGGEFPAGTVRAPQRPDYDAGFGVIRAVWPDRGLAVRAWTEGHAPSLVQDGFGVAITGFPLVHLKEDDETDADTIAHELAHALHFAKLNPYVRIGLETSYGIFLATDEKKSHCFERRTNPTVAWIEAFGFFGERWTRTKGAADREQALFDDLAARRDDLMNPNPNCEDREDGPMFGDDVEGALILTLFHDFARNPDVGLDFVVRTYVDCQSMDFRGYAQCIEDRHGSNSAKYRALVQAAACYGIHLDGAQPIGGAAEGGDTFGASLARGDFNGDGFDDIAIGTPYEAVGTVASAGMVNLLYGLPSGLDASCNAIFTQDSPGVPGSVEIADRFGTAVAAGDFDADGFDDLAIGAPGESIGTIGSAGYVVVLYGSARGIDAARSGEFWEDAGNVDGTSEVADQFGASLAAGDLDGDGVDDLAVGIPGQDVGSAINAGAVHVFRGFAGNALIDTGALITLGDNQLTQPEISEAFDQFGSSLVIGDFDGDGIADLAVGAPGERVGTSSSAGAASVFFGGASLSASASQHWTQDATNIAGVAASSDAFGSSLASADFDHDGVADLAIGVPGDDVGAIDLAGAVNVIYGSRTRSASPRNELWTQDSSSVVDQAEPVDRFGASLAAGDFDGDGFGDLAVGVSHEDVGSVVDAGAVSVLYGAAASLRTTTSTINGRTFTLTITLPPGLSAARNQIWSQDSIGIHGTSETGDRFGSALVVGDFNGDGDADLAVGVPYEDVGTIEDAGAIEEIHGAGAGLNESGDEDWDQDS